jgi:hypothetical protein
MVMRSLSRRGVSLRTVLSAQDAPLPVVVGGSLIVGAVLGAALERSL